MSEEQAPPAGDAPPEPGAPSGHAGHKGHHEEHGSHGGTWLITYCDMVTLLITFFICIVTFASRENGKQQHPRKRDSLLYGTTGTGLAGPKQLGMNHDSIIWRQLPACALPQRPGSEMAPLYSDPELEATAKALRSLEEPALGTLSDSYAMPTPLGLLFTADGKLSPSGGELLAVVASSLRRLPYDIYVQVDDPKNLPRAVTAAQHLIKHEGLAPFRVGVGVRTTNEPWNPSVWFLYAQRP